METLLQDLRYGLRSLRTDPGFTAVVLLTLALGIGASTAIFSVVNGVLLRPLPYAEPERLVRLFEKIERQAMSSDRMEIAPANFLDWRAQCQSFSDISAYGFDDLALAGDQEAENIASAFVSANLFSMLGVNPIMGRVFNVEEDQPGHDSVALLSHGLWQRRFGADPKVIGQKILLDGNTYTVIGVMPPGFQFPKNTELWTPLALNANQVKMREAHFLKAVARLKSDVSIEKAREEMNGMAGRLAEQFPQTNQNWGVTVAPLFEEEVGMIRPALLLLLGAVSLVLLIACVNVANLLLARATVRQSEIAIRLALGASRWRIIRQLLSESLLLALFGGSAGLLLALWGVDALLALAPGDLPRLDEVSLDGRVLSFAFIVSFLTGITFGLIPALQASKPDLQTVLKEGSRKTTGGRSRRWALNSLVVAEVTLALIVLIGAGLLINSFLRLQQVNPGLNTERVLTVKLTPPSARYAGQDSREQRLNFYNRLIPRLVSLPGVEAVGGIDSLPLGGSGRVWRLRKAEEEQAGFAATFQVVISDYFNVMGIQLKQGRLFTDSDRYGALPVAVINETMARRFWPNENATGKRIVIRNEEFQREIIGVVNDVKHFGLDREAEPEMYVPFNQFAIDLIPLVIRTKNDPAQLISAVRTEVGGVDPMVAISKIRTMPQVLSESLAQRRFSVLLLGIFAAVALALATVGIYGVISYDVSQRTHEIGIRMALGAQRSDLLGLVVKKGMALALIGIAIGLVASLAVTRLMASLLFGISATDPATFALVALLLSIVALLACYIPARRAAIVDLIVALRHE
jgi:predicted permease